MSDIFQSFKVGAALKQSFSFEAERSMSIFSSFSSSHQFLLVHGNLTPPPPPPHHSFFFSSMDTPPGPSATTNSRPPITDVV